MDIVMEPEEYLIPTIIDINQDLTTETLSGESLEYAISKADQLDRCINFLIRLEGMCVDSGTATCIRNFLKQEEEWPQK